jgi:hypothetical protein
MATETITVDVLFTDGQVDVDATTTLFASSLERRIAEISEETSGIAETVDRLLADNNGVAITMPTLSNMTASELGAPTSAHQVLAGRVLNYLRQNSQGKVDKDTKAEENPNSLFVIARGPGAGVLRRCDVKEKPAKTTKAAKTTK